MRSGLRLVVFAAIAALLVAACGGTSGSAAATVNGEEIPLDVVERLVSRKAADLGLQGEELRRVESAIDAGLIQRPALNNAIRQAVPQPEPELPDDALDAAFEAYGQSVPSDQLTEAREELGLDEQAWRELFDTAAHAEYQAMLANIPAEVSLDRTDQVAAAQREVLSLLVQIEAINQLFVERDLELEEGVVEERYQAELERAGGTEEALTDQLIGSGLDPADYRDIILTTVARQDAIVASFSDTTDEELQADYEAGLESGRFVVADVSHILVAPEVAEGAEPTPEARAEAEQEAQDLLDQLDDGADFAELAEQHSDDPGSAAQGGSLGENPLGGFVAEFRDAALEAPIGEVVGPVESQFGFHIIRVDSRREMPFDEALTQLRSEADQGASQEASAAIQQAIQEAEVEIPSRFGAWDPATARVVPSEPLDGSQG